MGGWDLMLFFRRCKRCRFGVHEFYRLHLTSEGGGGQLLTPQVFSKLGLLFWVYQTVICW